MVTCRGDGTSQLDGGAADEVESAVDDRGRRASNRSVQLPLHARGCVLPRRRLQHWLVRAAGVLLRTPGARIGRGRQQDGGSRSPRLPRRTIHLHPVRRRRGACS